MGLFSKSQVENINAIAQKSKSVQAPVINKKVSSINDELVTTSKAVEEYFKDSPAILIENKQQLHEYVTAAIEHSYVGIDTETTGLDRQNDYIVGASLYYPEGVECYIPMKHRIPIFEDDYKGQLSYEEVAEEFKRLVDNKVKLIFANANFDLYMIWKDLKVDLCPAFYYDVILAWRCLKEDELHNGLKELYNKYVLKGSGDPKRFSDFFSPSLFPYCKPEIAKLYAANDAKITYDLFRWQLPFVVKTSKQCQKNHLESIADLIWQVEFPLVSLIQKIERNGMYLDLDMAKVLQKKYHSLYEHEMKALQVMVQDAIDNSSLVTSKKPPFVSGKDFNPKSTLHVKYLLYTLLDLPKPQGKESTGKEVLAELNLPITSKIAEVRSLATNINTFVDKLPEVINSDGKIHADFKQIGASTGRMSSASPNLQNIPSRLDDIRHMFRAEPASYIEKDLDDHGDFFEIKIPKIYQVKLASGEYTPAYALNQTCKVIVNNRHVPHIASVLSLSIEGGDAILKLSKFMGDSWTISIRTPGYVMMSSDFSQQEPKITAFVSQDPNMIRAFQEGKDIYATIASIAFNTSYESCLEFHPSTGEYQPEGKARRNEAKTIVLGICYGRSVPSIGEQLYSSRDDMTDEEKTKEAQRVYDSVMRAFPALERLMIQSQSFAHKHGYVETILGRRRHLPDMMLDEFEFKPLPGYVNPDIDPLDLSTLNGESGIPEYRIRELKSEFSKFKYYGQVVKRTKQLYEDESIKVVNNRPKINDAKRQCVNCVDSETEILTFDGWKRYDQINKDDKIISYSLEDNKLVEDRILDIHIQKSDLEDIEVYHLSNSTFDAVCTLNHRWVMRNFDTNNVRFYETDHILKFHRPRYHILRIADNDINNDTITDNLKDWVSDFLSKKYSYSDILKLSSNDANKVYQMFLDEYTKLGCVDFSDEILADQFQIICLLAGKVSNKRVFTTNRKKKENTTTFKVTCSKKRLYETARIDLMKKEPLKVNLVWCITTECGTWIARRDGKYYITGNSIIQGSAADFTKTALIRVMTDPRWKEVGGQVLTVVHDEIVAQVPVERWEEGAKILKEDMESAGEFLPFPIKCDITATYRWYGLEIPCKFNKPSNLLLTSENDISWIQWHLVEIGFELPVFKDENGNKPIGDAAHGVSGIASIEMRDAIKSYCNRYNISEDEFLDDIERRVETGK